MEPDQPMGSCVTVYLNSAGATNAVNVMNALRRSHLEVRIIAGDCDPLAVGLFLADKGYVVPKVDDAEFLPKLLHICREERVDVALPIYSADFPVFARYKETLIREGIRTYAPSLEAWGICNDKYRIIQFFSSLSVTCPKTWTYEEAIAQAGELPYPLFLKRRSGSGTKDVQVLETRRDLEYFAGPDFVVQEYLDGEEFTVDVFSDLDGKMVAASPRKRTKVYGGLSVRGVTVNDEEILQYTRCIVESLALPGPSNVQCKRTSDGNLKFFEVNPRFASGGLPLAVTAGLNSPELLVRLLMGWELPDKIEIQEGIIMDRYWDALFIRSKEAGGYEVIDRY